MYSEWVRGWSFFFEGAVMRPSAVRGGDATVPRMVAMMQSYLYSIILSSLHHAQDGERLDQAAVARSFPATALAKLSCGPCQPRLRRCAPAFSGVATNRIVPHSPQRDYAPDHPRGGANALPCPSMLPLSLPSWAHVPLSAGMGDRPLFVFQCQRWQPLTRSLA